MKYLFVKMRRDLVKMWTQFLSVFLMAFLAVTIFSAMEGAYNGLDNDLNNLYKETNASDAVIYAKNADDEDIDKIKDIKNINNTSRSMTSLVKVKDSDKDIKLIASDDYSISEPHVVDGKKINSDDEGVWLDKEYASKNKISTGDYITLEFGDRNEKYKVNGLIIHPEYVYYTGSTINVTPDYDKHGYAVTNEKSAKKLFGKIMCNEIRIDAKDGFDSKELKKEAEDTLDDKYVGYGDRDSIQGFSNPIDKVSQVKKMSILFSAIFILLSMLTMQTTMSRLIKNQKIQIATLKALGFKKSQIMIHYSLYSFVIAILGGTCGLIFGPNLISPVIEERAFKALYSLPKYTVLSSAVSYLLPLAIAVICTITTILSCRKDLRGMVAESLRGDIPSGGKKILLEKINFLWNRINLDSRWSLRDISANKVRTVMGIIGVVGCMMLIMAGLGAQNTLNHSNEYIYNTEYKYNTKAVLTSNATDKNRDEIESLIDGKKQWAMESSADLKNGDKEKKLMVEVFDEGDYVNLETTEGTFKKLPEEGAFITRKTAEVLNLNKGDKIKFRITGESDYIEVKVEDILKCPSPQGVFMSKKSFESLGETFKGNALLMENKEVKDSIKDLSYVSEYSTIKEQEESAGTFADSLQMIFMIMIFAAITLAVVILYNLGVLSYTERNREYATLKVLGFYQSEITKFALRENIITTVAGWLIGVPVGFAFLNVYMKVVSLDTFDMLIKLSWQRLLIATIITVGCSIGVSLILSLKVKKINMVESLKSVE